MRPFCLSASRHFLIPAVNWASLLAGSPNTHLSLLYSHLISSVFPQLCACKFHFPSCSPKIFMFSEEKRKKKKAIQINEWSRTMKHFNSCGFSSCAEQKSGIACGDALQWPWDVTRFLTPPFPHRSPTPTVAAPMWAPVPFSPVAQWFADPSRCGPSLSQSTFHPRAKDF